MSPGTEDVSLPALPLRRRRLLKPAVPNCGGQGGWGSGPGRRLWGLPLTSLDQIRPPHSDGATRPGPGTRLPWPLKPGGGGRLERAEAEGNRWHGKLKSAPHQRKGKDGSLGGLCPAVCDHHRQTWWEPPDLAR